MSRNPPASKAPKRYRARNAQASPLYRIVQDHLEEYLVRPRDPSDRRPGPNPLIEKSLRSFLECGIHRFGVIRYRCKECGNDLFVAYSCKRRGVCPSCDSKRAVVSVARATDELLPDAGYRQWVLVIPKRLRYFVHLDPSLAGAISAILARRIELYLRRKAPGGYPAQIHFIQRFGERLNRHVHVHAVVAEGTFSARTDLLGRRKLGFHQASAPSEAAVAKLVEDVRRRVLRLFQKRGYLSEEAASDMLAWENSGFSVHAGVMIEAGDRHGLERLLYYCARPALSLKRLGYKPEENLVTYRTGLAGDGKPRTLRFEPVEFLRRFVLLAPPPKKNVIRYYGVLGPHSKIRPLVVEEARKLSGSSNRACLIPALKAAKGLGRIKEALKKSASSWAACLSRVFEVDPLVCLNCGGELAPVAAITNDVELSRLLAHLSLPVEFPKTAPARSRPPPDPFGEDCQINPLADLYLGIDDLPADDVSPA